MQGWFVLPLLGYAMVFGTHIILNAFAALWWRSQGIPAATVGQLIMLGRHRRGRDDVRLGPGPGPDLRPDAASSSAGSVRRFRWTAMALRPRCRCWSACSSCTRSPSRSATCRLVQFIASHTRDRIAAEAQSFYIVLQPVMSVIAVLASAGSAPALALPAYFFAGAFALLGALTILAGIALRPAEAEPDRA